MPSLMPKSTGLRGVLGEKVMLIRLNPKRSSLTALGPKVWISLTVPIWRCDCLVSPKPGMVLPCRFGSPRLSRWNA